MLGDLNENMPGDSDKVHLREIVVTFHLRLPAAAAWGAGLHRLPSADGVDISAATPHHSSSKDDIMATERTFSIIKPDATARNLTGAVNAVIEKAGLRIVAQKRIHMTREQAGTFYAVHKERPFFGELVEFMTSAPVVVQVLEGEGAVLRYRDVMGATDPAKAAEGTIRKLFAKSIGENSVHGSDAPETAAVEIAQFFSGNEIVG
jgi:nucleoside-diphosphate kinase